MGQEIEKVHFKKADFERFQQQLEAETEQLTGWFDQATLCGRADTVGFELEGWLVNRTMHPNSINAELIERADDPNVVPELAAYNIEFNNPPHPLSGNVLSRFHDELSRTLQNTRRVAGALDSEVVLCGILPTVEQSDLCIDNMSTMQRYRALNEQVLRMREGRPLRIDIRGDDHLITEHGDVMLEASTTSFQLHMKVSPENGARIYNLSKIVSAPMVAVSANSPFLFGHSLWEETRIPLFEQSVDVAKNEYNSRVGFGIRYAHESLLECFQANIHRYPVLIPMVLEDDGTLPHLRLHNGTIWRWNRPLLGFNDDGKPHLRIEHRAMAAGPSARDCIANAAFFFGAVHGLLLEQPNIDHQLTFEMARENFYAAARLGLEADAVWNDGEALPIRELIMHTLLPLAARGLESQGIDQTEIDRWLGIVRDRVESGINGAQWQRRWVQEHGKDWEGLTRAYARQCHGGRPVHDWDFGQ